MKDDDIIASIIAGAETGGRRVIADMSFGTYEDEPTCAVGAGLLYRGVDLSNSGEPVTLFAKHYDVPRTVAIGISDGFEWDSRYDASDSFGRIKGQRGFVSLFDGVARSGKNYERGWAIGAAIRAALADDGVDEAEIEDTKPALSLANEAVSGG